MDDGQQPFAFSGFSFLICHGLKRETILVSKNKPTYENPVICKNCEMYNLNRNSIIQMINFVNAKSVNSTDLNSNEIYNLLVEHYLNASLII